MTKTKTLIAIILSIVLFLMLGTILFVIYGYLTMEEPNLTTHEENILILNKKYPSDIVLYGDEIDFSGDLQYRKIVQVEEFSLEGKEFKYHFIIVNNMANNISLTQDEWDLIGEFIINKHYTFLYIGMVNQDLSQVMIKAGILDTQLSNNCRGFMSGYQYGAFLYRGVEILQVKDLNDFKEFPQLLGEVLVTNMVDVIKREN